MSSIFLWNTGLLYAKQVLYHWTSSLAYSPAPFVKIPLPISLSLCALFSFNKWEIFSCLISLEVRKYLVLVSIGSCDLFLLEFVQFVLDRQEVHWPVHHLISLPAEELKGRSEVTLTFCTCKGENEQERRGEGKESRHQGWGLEGELENLTGSWNIVESDAYARCGGSCLQSWFSEAEVGRRSAESSNPNMGYRAKHTERVSPV